MIGREIDLKIIIMIRKMAPMEITFTRTRSASVVSWRSFISGASPITIAVGSYFFTISLMDASWAFTSSVAEPYSEHTNASSYWSPLKIFFRSSGIIDSGTVGPIREFIPRLHFTPSTLSISFNICCFCLESIFLSIIIIWILPTAKVFSSSSLAMLQSKVDGRDSAIL